MLQSPAVAYEPLLKQWLCGCVSLPAFLIGELQPVTAEMGLSFGQDKFSLSLGLVLAGGETEAQDHRAENSNC